ncbi:YggT family protein [Methylovulum psychrotolerans]|uniref:YggT family protein n=1 Tax=Methylovulum psychrotolerans TaxID=1704499 RepID=UPI001BFEF7CB|nr:YggT family protein [Methylovulum psychrotolerans]MBT9098255.1 YggT family protein [Methylovulum psychrotolerans]
MDSSYLTDPIILVVDSLSSLYIMAVLLRFLLQWCGTSFYNPIAQLLLKITHPPLRVLRRFIPPIGRTDTSSLVLVLALQMLANFVILILKGVTVNIGALAILSMTDVVALLLNIFIFAVFARALLSWINPGAYDSASSMLASLTDPLLALCRKFIPDVGGIDLSPLAALLFLQLAKMLVLPPLQQLASLLS